MSLIKPINNPPRVATWLLEHAGLQNDALAGDLLDEFRQGRSARWYWRQALAAPALAFSNAILTPLGSAAPRSQKRTAGMSG